jgi:hypothetical protein
VQTTAQPSQFSFRGLVRIIPNQQSKILFCSKSPILLSAVSDWRAFPSCGGIADPERLKDSAPRSLARRWLGSRYPLLSSRALTFPLASSHVLAALARRCSAYLQGGEKHVKAWWARRNRFAAWLTPTRRVLESPGCERWWILHTLPCKHVKSVRYATVFFSCFEAGVKHGEETKTCTSVQHSRADLRAFQKEHTRATEPPFLCKRGRLWILQAPGSTAAGESIKVVSSAACVVGEERLRRKPLAIELVPGDVG